MNRDTAAPETVGEKSLDLLERLIGELDAERRRDLATAGSMPHRAAGGNVHWRFSRRRPGEAICARSRSRTALWLAFANRQPRARRSVAGPSVATVEPAGRERPLRLCGRVDLATDPGVSRNCRRRHTGTETGRRAVCCGGRSSRREHEGSGFSREA